MKEKIHNFLQGWQWTSVHQRPNTFWKYLLYYPLNWFWTLGSLLFMGLFIFGAIEKQSPLLWTATSFPTIMLIYNLVDEYFAFQWYTTGKRKVSGKTLINITKYLCSGILLYMIIRTFITG